MKSSDSAPARILVADDQEDVLSALRLLLKSEGYRAETVNSPAKALAALEHSEFDAVLIDLNYARDTTSGQEGLAPFDGSHYFGNFNFHLCYLPP